MSRTLSNNTSESTQANVDYFRNQNLSLVLGYTNKTKIENSVDSYADSVANSNVAIRLKDSDFKTCIEVDGSGGNRKWTSGTIPGSWKSSGDTGRQFLFESSGGVVFMVTGFPGQKYRSDKEGSVISTDMFTDVSGDFAVTSDGIEYIAINASSTGINSLSSKYIQIELPEESLGKKLESSTSLSTNASNICGSGNEQLIGTCCLYYKTAEYDPVAGVTHNAGDFYMCDCTRCYRCIELAGALDKKYVFTGGTGSTGTDCGCLADGQETYPTDCGPCDCTIDWNTTSDYSSVLANRNYPDTSSANRNATIVKKQKEDLSGCIVSITIDLNGLTDNQLELASSYESKVDAGTLWVPLEGSCLKEAKIEVSTVRDGVTYKYRADGIRKPIARGKNYTSVSLNQSEWSNMFPGIDPSRVSINVMPVNGFASSIPNFLPVSFVIHKVINKSEIEAVTNSKDFNFFTITQLKDINGASVYAGYAPEQTNIKDLVPVFNTTLVGSAAFSEADMSQSKEVIKNPIGTANSMFESTSISEIVPYAATSKESGDMSVPIQTAFIDEKVGTTLRSVSSRDWEVVSISSRPTGSTSEPIDKTTQKIIHRGSIGNFTLTSSDANHTIAFELKMGAKNQTIS